MVVDVVIPHYGDAYKLDTCVRCVQHDKNADYNIITVDDNETKLGFTKSCNIGIRKGTAEFIWLLNNDAWPLTGSCAALIYRMSTSSRIGIVGSMQHKPDMDTISFGGGLAYWPYGVHAGGSIKAGHCSIACKQAWVNGASMILRRSMLDQIGLLDENLEMFYSDSDICLTAAKNNWEVWYEPASRVIHELHVSKTAHPRMQIDKEIFGQKWGLV